MHNDPTMIDFFSSLIISFRLPTRILSVSGKGLPTWLQLLITIFYSIFEHPYEDPFSELKYSCLELLVIVSSHISRYL